jgi:hypothetical protein
MAELETAGRRLETVEEPVLLHSNLAQVERQQVARLIEALNDEHHRSEAAEIIGGLIDRVTLTPERANGQALSIDLDGAMAGILALATMTRGRFRPLVSARELERTMPPIDRFGQAPPRREAMIRSSEAP